MPPIFLFLALAADPVPSDLSVVWGSALPRQAVPSDLDRVWAERPVAEDLTSAWSASLRPPVSTPTPAVVAPAPAKTVTTKSYVPTIGWHVHTCKNPMCGYEWSHEDTNKNNLSAHTCPACSTVLPSGWKPSKRNTRIIETVSAAPTPTEYNEILARVRKGSDVLLSVGKPDPRASVWIPSLPDDTPPGLWRCYLENGVPKMVPAGESRVVAPTFVPTVFSTYGRLSAPSADWCPPGQT